MRIQLESVSFSYDHKHPILQDIDLDLEGPGLVCILGPNGVGKSTMIKCMNKLLRPTSGTVLLDEVNVTDMTQKEVAAKIGYVPVRSDDVFAMTVAETVMIGRHVKQTWRTTSEDIVKVHRVLEALGMEEFADRGFDELSAGQHQSIAIARGLVQETEILILDEPTSNLDVNHQMFITELLKEVAARKNVMILMISHNLNIAAKYADKIILMAKPGRIYAVGTAEEVLTKENLEAVYEVNCDVMMHEGRPVMLLNSLD